MLWATRVAGRPNSYFRQQSIETWADRWNVPHPNGLETADFDRNYIAAMKREGSAGTGIFGIRVMWESVPEASRRIARAANARADFAELVRGAFGQTLYVHVSRGDKVAQAVSRLRAEQSGVWHLGVDGRVLEGTDLPAPISYDQDRIAAFVSELNEDDAGWSAFFNERNIEPLRLTYETTVTDPAAALGKVLEALSLDPALAGSVSVPTAKMGDDTSRLWMERYRASAAGR